MECICIWYLQSTSSNNWNRIRVYADVDIIRCRRVYVYIIWWAISSQNDESSQPLIPSMKTNKSVKHVYKYIYVIYIYI